MDPTVIGHGMLSDDNDAIICHGYFRFISIMFGLYVFIAKIILKKPINVNKYVFFIFINI